VIQSFDIALGKFCFADQRYAVVKQFWSNALIVEIIEQKLDNKAL